jgi:hypothetical protein
MMIEGSGTGSGRPKNMWIRISDPDPQHWFLGYVLFLQRYRIQVLAHHLSPGYLCLLDRVADLINIK